MSLNLRNARALVKSLGDFLAVAGLILASGSNFNGSLMDSGVMARIEDSPEELNRQDAKFAEIEEERIEAEFPGLPILLPLCLLLVNLASWRSHSSDHARDGLTTLEPINSLPVWVESLEEQDGIGHDQVAENFRADRCLALIRGGMW